jgi:hypothetical protein
MATTWERFHQAALALVGAGTVKHRLAMAYRRYLYDVDPDMLPREVRSEFQALASKLTSARAVGGLGVVEATVRKMSDFEATRCAERIVELFYMLESPSQASRPHGLRAVSGQS